MIVADIIYVQPARVVANAMHCLKLLMADSTQVHNDVNSVAFLLDGHQITSGSDDGTIRVWNIISSILSHSARTGSRSCLAQKMVHFAMEGNHSAGDRDVELLKLVELAPALPRPLPLAKSRPLGLGERVPPKWTPMCWI